MWAERSHHAVFVGCVDPTTGEQCTRAVSTIALLNELAQARLPPLPKRVAPAVPAVLAVPVALGLPAAVPPIPTDDAADNAHQSGWAKVPIVDEDIRAKVQEVSLQPPVLTESTPDEKQILILAEQKLSGLHPMVDTLEQLEVRWLCICYGYR